MWPGGISYINDSPRSCLINAKFFLILVVFFLSGTSQGQSSTASFNLEGVVKPVVQLRVWSVNSKLFIASVLSNNPDGFHLKVDHDGVLNPQDDNPGVDHQLETKTFNFNLRFTSVPTYVSVSIITD